MNQEAYRELTIPVLRKVLELTQHLPDLTLCQTILMGFEGVRIALLKDFVPGGAAKSLAGVPFVDIFVKSANSASVAFHEDLSLPMPEKIPGIGYIRDVNETQDAFYQEIAQDICNWLVNKILPESNATIH